MFSIIFNAVKRLLILYLLLGLISLFINRKYFFEILKDRKFRKLNWKIVLLIETVLLWPLTVKLSYKIIRNYFLKKKLNYQERDEKV